MRSRRLALRLSDALTGLTCFFLFATGSALFLHCLLPVRHELINPRPMPLMLAFYSRGTRLFPFAALSGLAMIPAPLAQDGHHLVDLVASLVVFLPCLWLSQKLTRHKEAGPAL